MSVSICSSRKAFEILRPQLRGDVEEFWAVALSSGKRPLLSELIFRGTADSCLVHPRDVFRFGLRSNASTILVAHNHPSGDLRPSREDILVTERLVAAGRLLQIPVVDHILIAESGYRSFFDEGWVNF